MTLLLQYRLVSSGDFPPSYSFCGTTLLVSWQAMGFSKWTKLVFVLVFGLSLVVLLYAHLDFGSSIQYLGLLQTSVMHIGGEGFWDLCACRKVF